jgi:hypothetical protein
LVQGPDLQPPGSYFDYTLPSPADTSFAAGIKTNREFSRSSLMGLTLLLILAAAGVVAYFLFSQHPSRPLAAWLTIFAGLALCIGISWLFLVMRSRAIKATRQAEEEQQDRERASESGITGEDVRARNQRRIDEYNKIAWAQARGSYRNSQIAMSIGLALLVGGVVATILETQTAAQVVVGSLAGLGSAVSAYLGATFIRTYNEAINQMNYYYGQPLVHSYLLEAERMSMGIPPDARNEVMTKVIDATLAGAADAGKALIPSADRRKKFRGGTRQSTSEPGNEPSGDTP